MKAQKTRAAIIGGALLAVAAAIGAATFLRHRAAQTPHDIRFPDGVEASFRGFTRVEPAADYATSRQITVDGEALLRLPANGTSWTVRTRLLIITVDAGSELKIVAHWDEPGEQADVLTGHAVVRKSYPSPYNEPEELSAGELVLINREIDLMEKERSEKR
jgi:hypothetical protein